MALSKNPDEGTDSTSAILGLYRELQHIEAKDGMYTEWEEKRIEALNQILRAEPPLRNLLANLDVRQREEVSAYLNQPSQNTVLDEKYFDTCDKQYRDLAERHTLERQRYIREYHDAKETLADIQAQDRRETLDRGPDQDEPEPTI